MAAPITTPAEMPTMVYDRKPPTNAEVIQNRIYYLQNQPAGRWVNYVWNPFDWCFEVALDECCVCGDFHRLSLTEDYRQYGKYFCQCYYCQTCYSVNHVKDCDCPHNDDPTEADADDDDAVVALPAATTEVTARPAVIVV
jgi:hypothetical protein